MIKAANHINPSNQRGSFSRPGRWLAVVLVIGGILFCNLAFAQNTKGDKPTTQQKGPFLRLPKIKSKSKHGDKPITRDIAGRRRIRTKNVHSANRVIYKAPNPYQYADHKKGDHPAKVRGRVYNTPPHKTERAWKGTRDGSSLTIRSVTARRARENVYPQRGPYVNNKSNINKQKKVFTTTASGKAIYKSAKPREQAGRARGGYGSASGHWVTRGRKNVYWGKFSKGEKPVTKDLTGRPLRNLNFHSGGVGVGNSDTLKYVGRRPGRDRAGSARLGGVSSATRYGNKAWLGDISGHAIRRRPPRRSERIGLLFEAPQHAPRGGQRPGKMLKGGGIKVYGNKRSNAPLPARAPGIGANGIAKYKGRFLQGEISPGFSREGAGYRGSMKTRRPAKGGGSVSGKSWNNNRQPLQVRGGAPGFDKLARFPGNFKRGELSPGIGRQGYGYSGNIKAHKPVKGGGSVSGKHFNNGGNPINVRAPGSNVNRAWMFSGNMKAKKPVHGGGSVSGKSWNNNGQALPPRSGAPGFDKVAHFPGSFKKGDLTPGFGRQGYGYSGNMKAKKPVHGGGSVSRRSLNNGGKAIDVKIPSSKEARFANYSGKMRMSGLAKKYIQNPKAAEESLKKRRPTANTYLADGWLVKRKRPAYSKKPHANENAMLGVKPPSSSLKAAEYDHAMKMYWSYKRNPNSNEDALMGVKPGKNLARVTRFSGKTRQTKNYIHNPSSHHDALKVLAPGRAYARINDYQGNQRMRKYNDHRFHPDSQFAHGFRNNVKEERTFMMNVKLLWAKLFKKNDNQPEAVKAKEHKPRYDRKEKDLWKALYD